MYHRVEECLDSIVTRLKMLEKGNETPVYNMPIYKPNSVDYLRDVNGDIQYQEEQITGYLDIVTPYLYNLENALTESKLHNSGIGVEIINMTEMYDDIKEAYEGIHWENHNGNVLQSPLEYNTQVTYQIIGFNRNPFPTKDKLSDNDYTPSVLKIMDHIQLLLSGWAPTPFSQALVKTGASGAIPIAKDNKPYGLVAFTMTLKHLVVTDDEWLIVDVPIIPDIHPNKVDLMEELNQ